MGIVSEACCGPKKQQSYTIVLEVVAPLLEVIDSFTPVSIVTVKSPQMLAETPIQSDVIADTLATD